MVYLCVGGPCSEIFLFNFDTDLKDVLEVPEEQ